MATRTITRILATAPASTPVRIPPAVPDLALPSGFSVGHRWAASQPNPANGSELQSVPDTAQSAGDPLLRIAPDSDNTGSPEPTLVTVADQQVLRVQGVNVQSQQQYQVGDSAFFAVFRCSVTNSGFLRLGSVGWGRDAFSKARINLGGGATLLGSTATAQQPLLCIVAVLKDAASLVAAVNGTDMVASGTYTPSTIPAARSIATTVTKGTGALGSRSLDLVEMGTIVNASAPATMLTAAQARAISQTLWNAYPSLQAA